MDKELKETRRMVSEQIGNINRQELYKTNSGIEKYCFLKKTDQIRFEEAEETELRGQLK